MSNSYRVVLSIAGSDPSGGAGLQADLKTFSALGCYGMAVVTALTAQNTQGVTSVRPVAARCVQEQLERVLEDIKVDAIKIGVLPTAAVVRAVRQCILQYPSIPVVLDPVITPKRGRALSNPAAVRALHLLLPLTTVITPNLYEASQLLQRPVRNQSNMERAAYDLLQLGCKAVLIKGGHLSPPYRGNDYLAWEGGSQWLRRPTILTKNTHGTGCTYSSAIAALLTKGFSLPTAVEEAKTYLHEALVAGSHYRLGKGCGPVHHFYKQWT